MRLIVFSGLCGSGKSTAAIQEFGVFPSAAHTQILAYDDIRRREPELSPAEVTFELLRQAHRWLSQRYNVVLDACNLYPEDYLRWETLAVIERAKFEWRRISTPVDECIRRDAMRILHSIPQFAR